MKPESTGGIMIRIDVCIETVYPDIPYDERIKRVSRLGYDCVEMWFHDSGNKNLTAIGKALKNNDVALNNLVVNSPDGSTGGYLVKSEDRQIYLKRLAEVMKVAKSLGCSKAITCTGNCVEGLSRQKMKESVIETLSEAAVIAGKNDFTLLLEPLNTIVDHPGYFLDSANEGAQIVRKVNSPNLKLLYDIYHMQIMEGNLSSFIEKNIDIIGHFHSAGVPGRHELFDGEINYLFILELLERLGYSGSFGLEYVPAMADHNESLKAVRKYIAEK
jgi:hydroxypyruvate isomerase